MLALTRDGVLAQPVAASYPLGEWRAALEHAFRGGRGGKIMFRAGWHP
jgi:hypothetical protein